MQDSANSMEEGLGFEVAKGSGALVDFDDDGRVKRTGPIFSRPSSHLYLSLFLLTLSTLSHTDDGHLS